MNAAKQWSTDILVLLTHRDRLVGCNTFEEFKAQQIRLLDYMIESFEAKSKVEAAAEKFLTENEA